MIRLVGIGALGNMLSPAARHLQGEDTPGIFVRIYDRNPLNANRQQRREEWLHHGSKLVTTYEELIKEKDFDGIFICAGKNGDDLPIIKELIKLINYYYTRGNKPFIVHLSTVSIEFVESASVACKEANITYVNYPLTGGAKGAEQATMLILAAGDQDLYYKLQPLLVKLGQPKYLGIGVADGARVKLIGHILVFHGLMAISSAVTLQSSSIPLEKDAQIELFDFLNRGAGGTRQWDVALKQAVSDEAWHTGFLLPHAAIDAVYTADLLIKNKVPTMTILTILEIAAVFSFLLREKENKNMATQILLKYLLKKPADMLQFVAQLQSFQPQEFLQNVISSFPTKIKNQVKLDVSINDF